ncbi:MAG TPA: DUF3795 domain-containing protein [Syntrophales bacterium]|nr:DUF3795 domain-containing protein [Syntrophales bacterium]HPQ43959.1 DUF3795 domain-containing protein [Syntrophales bacterium]
MEDSAGGIHIKMIGFCGDQCTCCPRYRATQDGGKIELEQVKALWVRLGLRDPHIPVENMACHGCALEKECAYSELCACISLKALENCGLCDDYPCTIINSVFVKSEQLRSHAAEVCTREELNMLHKAFFSKRDYFDRIHEEYLKKYLL